MRCTCVRLCIGVSFVCAFVYNMCRSVYVYVFDVRIYLAVVVLVCVVVYRFSVVGVRSIAGMGDAYYYSPRAEIRSYTAKYYTSAPSLP